MLMACLMVLYFLFVHVAVGFGEDGVDVGGRQSCHGEAEEMLMPATRKRSWSLSLMALASCSSCTASIMRNSSPPMRKTAFVGQLCTKTLAAD